MSLLKHQINNNAGKQTKKIGLFGGSFDPIHLGHIFPIQHAAELLGLNQVHIIPANVSPLKSSPYSNNEHRAAMVKLVCQDYPIFTFDGRELTRGNASYTFDTLLEIHHEYQAQNTPVALYFFIGMDSLIDLTLWHRWQDILSLANIVVSPRPGYQLTSIPEDLKSYLIIVGDQPKAKVDLATLSSPDHLSNAGNILIMPEKLSDISSTEIRTLLTEPEAIKNKLPEKVYQYILQHQLY